MSLTKFSLEASSMAYESMIYLLIIDDVFIGSSESLFFV